MNSSQRKLVFAGFDFLFPDYFPECFLAVATFVEAYGQLKFFTSLTRFSSHTPGLKRIRLNSAFGAFRNPRVT